MTRRRWRAAAAALVAVAVSSAANAAAGEQAARTDWLFGADSSSWLFRIDPRSGAASRIGDTGVRGMSDIAFTPNGKLYGVSFTQLYRIDPRSGRATPIGSGLGMGSVNALASDARGHLYAASTGGDFGRVSPGTGRATRIGSYGPGLASSGDLAFAPNGALFATARSGGREVLLVVDPRTGTAALRGRLGFPDVYGLAFGPDGRLVGVGRGNSSAPVLISIDKQTGRTRRLGTLSGVSGMWGLATSRGSATTPAPAAPAARYGAFKTPSRNIVCATFATSVGCSIKSGLEPPPPPRRPGCFVRNEVFLRTTGRAATAASICPGEPEGDAGPLAVEPLARVLAYGQTWRGRNGLRCVSAETGLTCRNRDGHGFFLSRERWRAF